MTRGLPAAFRTELRSADPKILTLIEVETGDVGTPWIRLSSAEADTVWPVGGNTYAARPFEVSDATIDAGEFPTVTLRLADADGYWNTWLATTTFRHKKLIRYTIERDATAAATSAVKEVYRITKRDRTPHEFVLTARPIQAVFADLSIPRRTIRREIFPGMPHGGVIR